jgi:hypothetical protein
MTRILVITGMIARKPNGSSTAVLKVRRGIVEEIGIGTKSLTKGRKAQSTFLKSFT